VTIRRLVQNDYDLQDAADAQGVSLEDAARDLALLSVMASLTDNFGERIIFKGGAALRFAHGARRTSRDADATVTQPAKAPIPTEDVLTAIAGARMGQFLRYTVPKEPATATSTHWTLTRSSSPARPSKARSTSSSASERTSCSNRFPSRSVNRTSIPSTS
jgi:hypothetical protein